MSVVAAKRLLPSGQTAGQTALAGTYVMSIWHSRANLAVYTSPDQLHQTSTPSVQYTKTLPIAFVIISLNTDRHHSDASLTRFV